MITKGDFSDWKKHPVTEAVFDEIRTLIEEGTHYLSLSAGSDSVNDARVVGKINAYRTILAIEFGDVE